MQNEKRSNLNKISFITCVNNEELYNECVKYIDGLHVPIGLEVEKIAVRNANSMVQGYNHGMEQTDAKYKVYLHQDVFIVNKDFISDVINIFQNNDELGLVGLIGCKQLPLNCKWWEAEEKYGKVIENSSSGKMRILSYIEVLHEYESVQAIDGFLMVTQYDLRWKDDILDGWYVYDISQSQEFIDSEFKVGVINQPNKPWCVHDSGRLNLVDYEEQKGKFTAHYYNQLFPLVSILIPAYNRPYLLELALQSALYQSYQNIEIIIGDDSTNDEVKTVVEPYLSKYKNIKYYKNDKNLGIENWYILYDSAEGEYINFLMDDDLFHYEKIEKMVKYMYRSPNVKLVTTYRKLIDGHGEIIPSKPSTGLFFDNDTIIDGKSFGSYMLTQTWNVIGEPTTALFRKKDIERFGYYHNDSYVVINDFASWLTLMEKGDVVYLTEPLSYFRQHEGQNQVNPKYRILAIKEWLSIILEARNRGFLSDDKQYKEALINYLTSSLRIVSYYQSLEMVEVIKQHDTEEILVNALQELLRS